MKTKFILVVSLFITVFTMSISAQSYDNLWKEISAAQKKDLPKTVVGLCDKLITKAKKENNSGQLLQAYLFRAENREAISSDSLYANLKDMEQWCATTTKSTDRMVLHSLLADAYTSFAEDNRYEMPTNVASSSTKADDIREWTRVQFHDVVMKHIDASLTDIPLLCATKSSSYSPFAIQKWASKYYAHDLFHIICKRSISILKQFKIVADNKGEIDQRITKIYESMIEVYGKADKEAALALSSLDKIKADYDLSTNGDIYIRALDSLQRHISKTCEVCPEIYLAKASYYSKKQNKTKALALCNEAISLYPKYERINVLTNLCQDIKRSEATLGNVNAVVYPQSKTKITVKHRNLEGVDVLFYKLPESQNPIRNIKDGELVSRQHLSLRPTPNYLMKTDTLEVTMPELGLYAVTLEVKGQPIKDVEIVRASKLQVLTMRTDEGTIEAVVVNSKSGDLVAGAKVQLAYTNNAIQREQLTNAQGRAIFNNTSNSRSYRVRAIQGEDHYMEFNYMNSWFHRYSSDKDASNTTLLMNDRSIYRPGQTVYIKGLCYTQRGDNVAVRASQSVNLSLRDANGQEIANRKLTTNEFGSFTTSFILPSSCLNGNFSIHTDNGYLSFKVEEYKRPTFEVTTESVKSSYRLGDVIHIKGHAKNFSGVPIEGGMANFTITRERWIWWWPVRNKIVQTDSVKIESDGSFDIPVHLSDKDQTDTSEDDDDRIAGYSPYYTFNVNIDVTNRAGETQSGATSVAAGEQSLLLRRTSDERICKDKAVKVYLEATNLLHQSVDAMIHFTLSTMKNGKADRVVDSGNVEANRYFNRENWRKLASGRYLLSLTTKDSQDREVKQEGGITLFTATDKQPADNSIIWVYIPNQDKDGKTYIDNLHSAKFYFGTAKKDATILMDVFAGGKRIENKVLHLSNEIKVFDYPYKASYGDGIAFNFCFVKDGKTYQEAVSFTKTLPNKSLKLKWSVFRDKLRPGQKEEWKLNILTPNGKPANAELLAYMYDASLDQLVPHLLKSNIAYPRSIWSNNWNFRNPSFVDITYWEALNEASVKALAFDQFSDMDNLNWKFRKTSPKFGRAMLMSNRITTGAVLENAELMKDTEMEMPYPTKKASEAKQTEVQPTLRSNFAETAFFYPQLRTDAQGNASIVFTLPESLTRWKFQGLAHTKDMFNGTIESTATASKDFMLTPNMPRFVRTGDEASIAATISNRTDQPIRANVKFELFDPVTSQIIQTQNKPLILNAGKSEAASFKFAVTDRHDVLGVRMIADGATFSDGEQHLLPVLSDKIMLTESVPLPVRGNQTKEFSLNKLFNNHSNTATKRTLTVEYTGNPAWYAVQALPSLSLPESDNAISWATAFYANSLASHIANSMPRIKSVFDSWKREGQSKGSLLSNLQKNEELKNILLNESPWVLEAKSEQEQKERLSTLFDLNTMQNNNRSAIAKLQQLQAEDGGWSWYKGMHSSEYMSEYVLRLLARLELLTGTPLPQEVGSMQAKGINFLHQASQKRYEYIKKAEREGQKIKGVSYATLRYLYLVAITDAKVPSSYQTQYNYFLSKVNEEPKSQDMQEKAIAAVVLSKAGKAKAANEYMASLREHLTKSDELGEYFDFDQNPFAWGCTHLNAHTAAIEAFDKVANDSTTVEEMKLWLLKQKQTQQWDSPVSTADAIYALLKRGTDVLASQGVVNISFASHTLSTAERDASAGLGYIKKVYTDRQAVDASTIKVEKKDAGIAWGAAYAQFTESIAQVKQQGSSAFNVKKNLFVKRIVNNVEELQPITADTKLKVGDVVTARLVIQLDRNMDFVQLKEQRGCCFEPLTQLSGYHWGAGTGYYEEIKDASTNFFFDSLQKGVYVLEINYRAARSGKYEVGLSTLQCAYAPEFATYSDSMRISVSE